MAERVEQCRAILDGHREIHELLGNFGGEVDVAASDIAANAAAEEARDRFL